MINANDYVRWPVNGGTIYGQVAKLFKSSEDVSKAMISLPFGNGTTEQPVEDLIKISEADYQSYMNEYTGVNMSQANELEALNNTVADLKAQLETKNGELTTLQAELETAKSDLAESQKNFNEVNEKVTKIEATRKGEARLSELKEIGALAALEYDESDKTVETLASLSDDVYNSTLKMAKALIKNAKPAEKEDAKANDVSEKDKAEADLSLDVEDNDVNDTTLLAQASELGTDRKTKIQAAFARQLGVKLED